MTGVQTCALPILNNQLKNDLTQNSNIPTYFNMFDIASQIDQMVFYDQQSLSNTVGLQVTGGLSAITRNTNSLQIQSQLSLFKSVIDLLKSDQQLNGQNGQISQLSGLLDYITQPKRLSGSDGGKANDLNKIVNIIMNKYVI